LTLTLTLEKKKSVPLQSFFFLSFPLLLKDTNEDDGGSETCTISRASGASEGQRILLPARALFPRSYATGYDTPGELRPQHFSTGGRPQEEWQAEDDPGPEIRQQLYPDSTLHHGRHQKGAASASTWRLDHNNRSEGRVSPHSHPPGAPNSPGHALKRENLRLDYSRQDKTKIQDKHKQIHDIHKDKQKYLQ